MSDDRLKKFSETSLNLNHYKNRNKPLKSPGRNAKLRKELQKIEDKLT